MAESICHRTEDHPLGQTRPATPYDEYVGFVDLTDRDQTTYRIAQLFDRLEIDPLEIEVALDIGEDLLLTFDQRGR